MNNDWESTHGLCQIWSPRDNVIRGFSVVLPMNVVIRAFHFYPDVAPWHAVIEEWFGHEDLRPAQVKGAQK